MFKKSISVLLAVFCVSCASTYGHREAKIDNDSYIVSFYGSREEALWNIWMHRCAEFTKLNGYDYFSIVSLEHGTNDLGFLSGQAQIDMYYKSVTANGRMLDAQTILDALDPFVNSNGKFPASSRAKLFEKAIIRKGQSVPVVTTTDNF
jgi:hypothetical protein